MSNTNTEKYGIMFMPQGGETYKNLAKSASFWVAINQLCAQTASDQAKQYGSDKGIIQSIMDYAIEGAKAEGDSIRCDAMSQFFGAGIAAASIVGMGVMHFATRTNAIDAKIGNVKTMESELSKNEGAELEMEAGGKDPRDSSVVNRIKTWEKNNKESFDDFQKDSSKLKLAEKAKVEQENALNKEAIKQVRPEEAQKIKSNLEKYKKELYQERQKLEGRFTNFVQALRIGSDAFKEGLQGYESMLKAPKAALASIDRSIVQILTEAGRRQSQSYDSFSQQAQQALESGHSAAGALASVQNTSGR